MTLCRIRIHHWQYFHRRLPHGRGVVLFRTCSDCGLRQKWIIYNVADSEKWITVNNA